MELLQLKYFCDSAQTQNFSKTAQNFLVPPSNISQSVSRLERELGLNLFDRSSNKINLNKNGKDFYLKVKQALFLIEEAKKIVSDDKTSGEIKICIRTNRRYITDIAEQFKEKYPDASFVISHGIPEDNNDYDFIVADDTSNCGTMKKDLFIEEDILLAVSSNNPLSEKDSISKEDLKDQKFITVSSPSNLYTNTLSICNSMGFSPDISVQTDDPFYVRKYVSLNWGIAFVPSFSWAGMFDDNIILKKAGDYSRKTYIITNENRFMSKHAKLFYNTLKNNAVLK